MDHGETIKLSKKGTSALVTQVRRTNNSYVEAAVNILGGYDLKWQKDVPFLWLQLPEGWRSAVASPPADEGEAR